MLDLSAISIHVAGAPILAFDRLQVASGEIVSLLGPSGAGKSTLLRAIAGMSDMAVQVTGSIQLNGACLDRVPAHQRTLGYVEQRPVLFPHLNVQQNLAFGLKGPRSNIFEALSDIGLTDLATADVATLSGGQAARVSLMRTLLSRPQVLLLDEPFAALDPDLRAAMRSFVFNQVRTRGLAAVLVTHDRADAAAAAGPVYTLENQTLNLQTPSDDING